MEEIIEDIFGSSRTARIFLRTQAFDLTLFFLILQNSVFFKCRKKDGLCKKYKK